MPASYSVCGLGVQCNLPIAALKGLAPPPRIDVRITLGSLPPDLDKGGGEAREYFVDAELDEWGRPRMTVARLKEGRFFRLAFSEGVTLVVDSRGREVWATWNQGMTVEDAASYLTGSVLGFVLRLRGVTCVHGSAIAIGGRAIAVVGPSGSGKSSTAAGFARLGFALLTDDLIALRETREGFAVQPAFARVHLWPQSARSLFGSWDALPRIAPNWEKRHLDLDAHGFRFQHAPLPLAAIYFLGDRGAGESVRMEPVSAARALIDLVSDSHATEYVDKPQRAEEFDVLARLLEQVPCRRVTPCEELARVPELCAAIATDFERIAGAVHVPG